MDKFSLVDIKKINYSDVYHYIYNNAGSSKQAIASALGMSLPTVTQHLNSLLSEELIQKCGQLNSNIGRKAIAYSILPNARISLGIEILENYIAILAINLRGEAIAKRIVDIHFEKSETYTRQVSEEINLFIKDEIHTSPHILGIGFGMQGLVSSDGKEVIYGQILDYTGLTIDSFSKYLNYPCRFVHDSECAASSDLWNHKEATDIFYLSLSHHLGGAVILQGNIHPGYSGTSGVIEHMTLFPGGKECYCGKKGCADAYCAVSALLYEDETLEDFFTNKTAKSKEHLKRFDKYLDNLAIVINNIHMVINLPVMLGGHMSPYLEDSDTETLFQKVCALSAFPETESFISLGTREKSAIAIGAGLPFIKEYLDNLAL